MKRPAQIPRRTLMFMPQRAVCRRGLGKLIFTGSILVLPGVAVSAQRTPPAICPTAPAGAHTLAADSLSLMLHSWLQQLSDSLHAELGVAFRDLHTGSEFLFHEKNLMHAASTMKVPVMIEVFRQAEAGKFGMDDSVAVKNEFASIVDGSFYALDIADDSDDLLYQAIGKETTIRRLVEAMITVSSNLATNLLIELVQADNVMKTLAELGAHNMQVLRGVEDGKAYARGWNNRTDAYDLMLTLQALVQNRAAGEVACQEMITVLQRQKFRAGIPAGLPATVIIGNKTGSITAINHDAAILFPPGRGPCVMVVLTHGLASQERAQETIARIARRLFETFITQQQP